MVNELLKVSNDLLGIPLDHTTLMFSCSRELRLFNLTISNKPNVVEGVMIFVE